MKSVTKVARFGLGREHEGGIGSPAITQKPNGEYVLFKAFERKDIQGRKARQAAKDAAGDVARLEWLLPVICGSADGTADRRTLAVATALFIGLDGRAAIDHAMHQEVSVTGKNP